MTAGVTAPAASRKLNAAPVRARRGCADIYTPSCGSRHPDKTGPRFWFPSGPPIPGAVNCRLPGPANACLLSQFNTAVHVNALPCFASSVVVTGIAHRGHLAGRLLLSVYREVTVALVSSPSARGATMTTSPEAT